MAQYDYGYDEDEFDHPLSEPTGQAKQEENICSFLS